MIFASVSASRCMCVAKNRGGDEARFLLTYCLSAVDYSTQKPCRTVLCLCMVYSASLMTACVETHLIITHNGLL